MRNGNPRIAELGRATRFGEGGNCPVAARQDAAHSRSVKKALKRLMGATFSLDCPAATTIMDRAWGHDPRPVTLELLLQALHREAEMVSLTELLAMQAFLQALNGDLGAMMWIELMVDGPLLTEEEVRQLNESGKD